MIDRVTGQRVSARRAHLGREMALEMSCRVRRLVVLVVFPFALGCASVSHRAESDTKCPLDPLHMPAVSITEAFQLSSKQLACYGREFRLNCGLIHGVAEADREACRTYAAAVVTYLSRDSCAVVTPAPGQAVRYTDAGVCIDTFVSGRELDDCFDFIEAKISLIPSQAKPSAKSLERSR